MSSQPTLPLAVPQIPRIASLPVVRWLMSTIGYGPEPTWIPLPVLSQIVGLTGNVIGIRVQPCDRLQPALGPATAVAWALAPSWLIPTIPPAYVPNVREPLART